jgi:hypothetical protein
MYSPYFQMCLSFEFMALSVALLFSTGREPEAILLFTSWVF